MRCSPVSIGLLLPCWRGCLQWLAGRRRRGWRRNEGWRPFRHRPPQRLVHGRPTRGNRNGQHTGHWHRGAVRGPGLHFLRGESRPPVVARPPQVAGVPPSSVRWLSEALSLVKTRRAPLTLWKRSVWLSDTFRGRRGVRSAGKSAALSERLLFVFLLYPFRPGTCASQRGCEVACSTLM